MTVLYLAAPVIGLLLLAAHFLRAENYLAIAVALVVLILFVVRRPWAARTIQAALLLGSIEWLRLTISLVQARHAMGEPFIRLALILGAVSLFTALCALVFQASRIRAHFGLGSGPALKAGSIDQA